MAAPTSSAPPSPHPPTPKRARLTGGATRFVENKSVTDARQQYEFMAKKNPQAVRDAIRLAKQYPDPHHLADIGYLLKNPAQNKALADMDPDAVAAPPAAAAAAAAAQPSQARVGLLSQSQ